MKLCRDCRRTPWPFIMVAFISTLISFVTWLALGLAQWDAPIRLLGTAGVFAAVGGTLTHYVLSCMRRHCAQLGHQHHHKQPHDSSSSPKLDATG